MADISLQAESVRANPDASNMQASWEAATAAERFARSVMDQYRDGILNPLNVAHEAGTATFRQVRDAEEGWTPYTSAHAEAVDAVILTPAPDMAAIMHKLAMGIDDRAFDGSDDSARMLRVIREDVRRLSASPGKA